MAAKHDWSGVLIVVAAWACLGAGLRSWELWSSAVESWSSQLPGTSGVGSWLYCQQAEEQGYRSLAVMAAGVWKGVLIVVIVGPG